MLRVKKHLDPSLWLRFVIIGSLSLSMEVTSKPQFELGDRLPHPGEPVK